MRTETLNTKISAMNVRINELETLMVGRDKRTREYKSYKTMLEQAKSMLSRYEEALKNAENVEEEKENVETKTYKNVVNGKSCSMAIVERETEKAVMLKFEAEIYGEIFKITSWMPKSQISIEKQEGKTIWFEPKNDWILTSKVKDYCKYVASTFANVKREIKTFLSPINNEKITLVFC